MIRISRMRIDDLPFAVRLSAQEDWGTPRSDLLRILRISPKTSFVASEDNARVGMITAVTFNKNLAWIGNVIVDKKYRGKRIGQHLVTYAVDQLKRIHVKHIALYCFKENVNFYKKLGFIKDVQFVRLRLNRFEQNPKSRKSEIGKRLTLAHLLSLDKQASGVDRSKLIQSWINEGAGAYFGFEEGDTSAFVFVKKYSTMFDFGPGVSIGASDNELQSLLGESLSRTRNKPIEVSCLAQNQNVLRLLRRFGFEVTNIGYRMFYDHTATVGIDSASLLLGFLDKG